MLIGILVLVVIVLAAWFAYSQGYLTGKSQPTDKPDIQIDLPPTGTSAPTQSTAPRY